MDRLKDLAKYANERQGLALVRAGEGMFVLGLVGALILPDGFLRWASLGAAFVGAVLTVNGIKLPK